MLRDDKIRPILIVALYHAVSSSRHLTAMLDDTNGADRRSERLDAVDDLDQIGTAPGVRPLRPSLLPGIAGILESDIPKRKSGFQQNFLLLRKAYITTHAI
jgi:hypothetical protein